MNLDKVKIFDDLTKKEKEQLLLFCQERIVKNNDILFKEGDEANSMYIVKKGIFQAFKDNKILWEIKKWWLIWEMAIFQNKHKRNASVKSLTDSILMVISSYAIENISKNYEKIYKKIQKIIIKRKEENKK